LHLHHPLEWESVGLQLMPAEMPDAAVASLHAIKLADTSISGGIIVSTYFMSLTTTTWSTMIPVAPSIGVP